MQESIAFMRPRSYRVRNASANSGEQHGERNDEGPRLEFDDSPRPRPTTVLTRLLDVVEDLTARRSGRAAAGQTADDGRAQGRRFRLAAFGGQDDQVTVVDSDVGDLAGRDVAPEQG